MTHLKAKVAVGAAVAAIVAAPVVWQENAIARTRAETRELAALADALDRVGAQQNELATRQSAEEAAALAAGERADLERLRAEAVSLRGHLQQARAARLAATQAAKDGSGTPSAKQPGFVSIQDARNVGAGTGEALFQTFIWAMRTGDTNRLLQLVDVSPEGAQEALDQILREASSAKADFEAGKAPDIAFRVVRQVPLEDGDAAVVLETNQGADNSRSAMRIHRVGGEWHLVGGKSGPQEVKLSEELMRD